MNKVLYSLAYYLSTSILLFHINYIYSLISSLINWRTHTQGNKLLEITKILNKIGKVPKKSMNLGIFQKTFKQTHMENDQVLEVLLTHELKL